MEGNYFSLKPQKYAALSGIPSASHGTEKTCQPPNLSSPPASLTARAAGPSCPTMLVSPLATTICVPIAGSMTSVGRMGISHSIVRDNACGGCQLFSPFFFHQHNKISPALGLTPDAKERGVHSRVRVSRMRDLRSGKLGNYSPLLNT